LDEPLQFAKPDLSFGIESEPKVKALESFR
jgi:hypothetical protein